jgi:hypothetical protein
LGGVIDCIDINSIQISSGNLQAYNSNLRTRDNFYNGTAATFRDASNTILPWRRCIELNEGIGLQRLAVKLKTELRRGKSLKPMFLGAKSTLYPMSDYSNLAYAVAAYINSPANSCWGYSETAHPEMEET